MRISDWSSDVCSSDLLGNPPGDASRVMWPAFAKLVGIPADSVTFVNIAPQAKLASLKSHVIDITSDFYNEHDLKVREFGKDLGFQIGRASSRERVCQYV